ncbi:MAG: hypothetical protein ORN56_02310 [Chitinophagales bacterium]|nr:hypothetical protein [Chitinophagales bacterium]
MKKSEVLIGLLAVLSLNACHLHWGLHKHKQAISEEEMDPPREEYVHVVPNWVKQQIEILKTAPPYRTGKKMILEYRYQYNYVYYIPADCCDQLNPLYDEFGKKICAPDGGFTGKGDGRCPDFDRASQSPTIIWMEESPAK